MYKQRKPKLKPVPRNCQFCNTNTEPIYSELETLSRHISERGKILAQTRTGLCSKHQRRISQCIKQARYLALLPFVGK